MFHLTDHCKRVRALMLSVKFPRPYGTNRLNWTVTVAFCASGVVTVLGVKAAHSRSFISPLLLISRPYKTVLKSTIIIIITTHFKPHPTIIFPIFCCSQTLELPQISWLLQPVHPYLFCLLLSLCYLTDLQTWVQQKFDQKLTPSCSLNKATSNWSAMKN